MDIVKESLERTIGMKANEKNVLEILWACCLYMKLLSIEFIPFENAQARDIYPLLEKLQESIIEAL